jgi:hypothetical protein
MNPEDYNQVVYPRHYQEHWDYVKGHCEICDTDMGEFDATVNVDRCPGCNFMRGMLCATCKAKPRPKTYIEERHAACEAEMFKDLKRHIKEEFDIKDSRTIPNKVNRLKRVHGLSLAESWNMWEKSEGTCDACDEPFPSYISKKVHHDKCRTCGRIGGLLCRSCIKDVAGTKRKRPSFVIDYMLHKGCTCNLFPSRRPQ